MCCGRGKKRGREGAGRRVGGRTLCDLFSQRRNGTVQRSESLGGGGPTARRGPERRGPGKAERADGQRRDRGGTACGAEGWRILGAGVQGLQTGLGRGGGGGVDRTTRSAQEHPGPRVCRGGVAQSWCMSWVRRLGCCGFEKEESGWAGGDGVITRSIAAGTPRSSLMASGRPSLRIYRRWLSRKRSKSGCNLKNKIVITTCGTAYSQRFIFLLSSILTQTTVSCRMLWSSFGSKLINPDVFRNKISCLIAAKAEASRK